VIENDTLLADAEIDHWVYPGGRFLALGEEGQRMPLALPAPMPLLTAGGVRLSGVTISRRPYPFWQFDTLWHTFMPEEEYLHQPLYAYLPDTVLSYVMQEGFEMPQGALRIINSGEPDAASLRRIIDRPRRGLWCAEIFMAPNQIFQAESASPFLFPNNEIWLEISVRGDRNLAIGLTRENKQTGAFVSRDIYLLLRPPDQDWQTFYIPLTPWMQEGSGLYRYRLYLTSIADTTQSNRLYLDDIRILTFRL
jgi:hypothetical protein